MFSPSVVGLLPESNADDLRISKVLAAIICIVVTILLVKTAISGIAVKAAGYTEFPQSIVSSIAQYARSCCESAHTSQTELLKTWIDPTDDLVWEENQVRLTDTVVFNEVIVTARTNNGRPYRDVVLLHGFGAGLGFFASNFAIARKTSTQQIRLHAVDWLGMGLSSRPAFQVPKSLNIEQARCWVEDYFTEHLRQYLMMKTISKAVFIAHSFGAYFAVRFTAKFPNLVEQLILVSPVALNRNPYREHDLDGLVEGLPKSNLKAELRRTVQKRNPLPRYIVWLWEMHYTPFDFVRYATFLGPKLISAWTFTLKIPTLQHCDPEKQRQCLHRYTYRIFAARASTERALSYILVAGAHARSPLLHSLPTNIPVDIIYGKSDWMPITAGYEASQICNKKGGSCAIHEIAEAGHHCYLERSAEFNRLIAQLLSRQPPTLPEV